MASWKETDAWKPPIQFVLSSRGRAFGTKWGIFHIAILSLSSYSLWLSLQDDKMPIFCYQLLLGAKDCPGLICHSSVGHGSLEYQSGHLEETTALVGNCSSQRTQRHSVITSLTFSLVPVRWRYRTVFLHGSMPSKKAIFHSHILPLSSFEMWLWFQGLG